MSRIKHLLIPLVLLVVVKIIFIFPAINSLENKAQDTLFRVRGTINHGDEVVIVAIDNDSFSAMDRPWPFPREYHAKLIQNLNIAGAKLIIFDVEFTETANPEVDEMLAAIAEYYGNVVFAGKAILSKKAGDPSQLVTPIAPIVNKGLSWGIVNMSSDWDNVIRRYPLFELHDDQPYYTIGVQGLMNRDLDVAGESYQPENKSGNLEIGGLEIPMVHNRALINYYGPSESFLHVSYADVIDDEHEDMPGYQGIELDSFYDLLEEGIFEDKIVLIGATAEELHDNFPTPFGGDWTAGVEIHANFLMNALSANHLKNANMWLYFLIEIILVLLLWELCCKTKPQYSAMIIFGLVITQIFVVFILFKYVNILAPIVQTALLLIALYVVSLISHYLETMKEKRFIRGAFQQYMAPALVDELLKNPKNISYGGTLQEVSVLFSDVRGFTTYTETHAPEETVFILKEYLTEMVNTIIDNRGILDKFIGDAVMALFGTPIKLPNHAYTACRTALDMRERLAVLQDKWRAEGREIFEIGIGINTGNAVIGNLGSEQIFDYTAIGDTINLGARLESITKEYNTQKGIIISEFTLEHIKDLAEVRYLDEVKVKGKNQAVKIYELVSLRELRATSDE